MCNSQKTIKSSPEIAQACIPEIAQACISEIAQYFSSIVESFPGCAELESVAGRPFCPAASSNLRSFKFHINRLYYKPNLFFRCVSSYLHVIACLGRCQNTFTLDYANIYWFKMYGEFTHLTSG